MRAQLRPLLLDAAVLFGAAAARVLIEALRGHVWAGSALVDYFIPNFAWWWSAPRWLGGWNPWIFAGYPANADPEISPLHPIGLLYALLPPLGAASAEGI